VVVREMRVSGLECVSLATELLHRARLADAWAGLWEAADLQWWWRRPRRSDEVGQLFWVDDDDGPVAAAILTEWGQVWGFDPITIGSVPEVTVASVLARGLDLVNALGLADVETLVRDDDVELRRLLTGYGFDPAGDSSGMCWMDADNRPEVAAVAEGFTLVDRRQSQSPHPMGRRNGSTVEARLRQCSLYDPSLDLAVQASDGQVAGYALFWHDPVTRVGLVEPMRIEDAYQRRGLARALLTEGLRRLAARGARRMKVGYSTDIAGALYTGAGFRVTSTSQTYRRKRHSGER
jgi:ribosomal protein S18 acetylase RimI-like enzyme